MQMKICICFSVFFWYILIEDKVVSMLITIDVGNTSTSIIGYDASGISIKDRISTNHHSVDDFQDWLGTLPSDVSEVVVSCVVPEICDAVQVSCAARWPHARLKQVTYQNMNGFTSLLRQPHEIGADFIATSIGAYDLMQRAVLVVDIGSATKITVTDGEGRFKGGIIMPGIKTSLRGLTEFIPHLPTIDLEFPRHVIGDDTVSAMQSGIMFGLVAQIQGLTQMVLESFDEVPVCILTGGYGKIFEKVLSDYQFEPDLIHHGLKVMIEKELLL